MSARRYRERGLTLDADFARMPEARAFADEAAAAAGFGERDRYSIKMAFGEAVANAIEHGSSAGDHIDLRATVEGEDFVLYVRDYGTFVPRVNPRGELPERGRGLAFMAEMMDEVDLDPARDGTRLRLVKRLPGATPPPA